MSPANGSKVPLLAGSRPQPFAHGDGSVYMNERPKLGSEQGGLNVHFWVFAPS